MPQGESKLYSVYVPTNHVYVGDIFLLASEDIIKPHLSVREGLEIVVSVGTVVASDCSSSCIRYILRKAPCQLLLIMTKNDGCEVNYCAHALVRQL